MTEAENVMQAFNKILKDKAKDDPRLQDRLEGIAKTRAPTDPLAMQKFATALAAKKGLPPPVFAASEEFDPPDIKKEDKGRGARRPDFTPDHPRGRSFNK